MKFVMFVPLILSTNALKGLRLNFRKINLMNTEIYGNKSDKTSTRLKKNLVQDCFERLLTILLRLKILVRLRLLRFSCMSKLVQNQ